jgi:hypothetical protein
VDGRWMLCILFPCVILSHSKRLSSVKVTERGVDTTGGRAKPVYIGSREDKKWVGGYVAHLEGGIVAA